MRRRHRLSPQEVHWVDTYVSDLCRQANLNPQDHEYRSAAWLAFQETYQNWDPLYPDFWLRATAQMESALSREKQLRSQELYRQVSLHAPLPSHPEGIYLDLLPCRCGDFTNGTAFFDFLEHLPEEPYRLARHLIQRDSLEEARSLLGWSSGHLCAALEQLRTQMEAYEKI